MIALGLLLKGQRFHFDLEVGVDVLVKVIVTPLLVLGLAYVFAVGGDTRLALLLVAVTPTASGRALIAAQYKTNQSNAAATVLLTTLLSPVAIPVVAALF